MVSNRIKVTYLFHEHLQRDEDHGVKIPIPEEIIDFINRDAGLRSPVYDISDAVTKQKLMI